MAKHYRAKRDRYASDIDYYDFYNDAFSRKKRAFGTHIEAMRDNVNRVYSERDKVNPRVFVSGSVYKVPQKTYRRK